MRTHTHTQIHIYIMRTYSLQLFHTLWRQRVPVVVREAKSGIAWTPAVMKRVTKEYRDKKDKGQKQGARNEEGSVEAGAKVKAAEVCVCVIVCDMYVCVSLARLQM